MFRGALAGRMDDLLKVAGSVIPDKVGGGDAAGEAGATVATALLDNLYAKEQVRIQRTLDDADAVLVKTGSFIDWGRWALAGLAIAGVWLLVEKARRERRS